MTQNVQALNGGNFPFRSKILDLDFKHWIRPDDILINRHDQQNSTTEVIKDICAAHLPLTTGLKPFHLKWSRGRLYDKKPQKINTRDLKVHLNRIMNLNEPSVWRMAVWEGGGVREGALVFPTVRVRGWIHIRGVERDARSNSLWKALMDLIN